MKEDDRIEYVMTHTVERLQKCGFNIWDARVEYDETDAGVSGLVVNARDVMLTIGAIKSRVGSVRVFLDICRLIDENEHSTSMRVSRNVAEDAWHLEFLSQSKADGEIVNLGGRCGLRRADATRELSDDEMMPIFQEIADYFMS